MPLGVAIFPGVFVGPVPVAQVSLAKAHTSAGAPSFAELPPV